MDNKLKILFVSSEFNPFAKTGGLADVAGALPQKLLELGNDIRVVMPKYKRIDAANFEYVTSYTVWVGAKSEMLAIRKTEVADIDVSKPKLPVYFIDSFYFERDELYGYPDDGERFAFFCKAVLDLLPQIDFKPDIIHCNDWHTGPVCMLLKENEYYNTSEFYKNVKTIYTIHNLGYQGIFPRDIIYLFNVPDSVFNHEKAEFYGNFSYMKAGIVYSDLVTTVSKGYADEIQTAYYGEKLDGILKKRSADLRGIVNGICYDKCDPETDNKIYKNYSIDNLSDKYVNKYRLQEEFKLPQRSVPVIGLVSRLTEQKGLNLVFSKMDEMMKNDVQFVLLGTGDREYEEGFQHFRDKYPDKVGVYIGFSAMVASRIYAGCDMFLMPSRFEPCGLGQLISFRYGTIPIVRSTGGLADTVIDYDGNKDEGTGFSFHDFVASDMLYAIERALKVYNETPKEWETLVKRVLELDYSWNRPAKEYNKIYNELLLEGK